MKLLVVSDSHGDYDTFYRLVCSQSKAEVVFFLGDGYKEFEEIKYKFPDKMFIGVKGNNDWCCPLNSLEIMTFAGKKFYITHGHNERVKFGSEYLKSKAAANEADIILYGHTHEPHIEYCGGVHIMNPGSIHRYTKSYGVIDIQGNDVLLNTAVFPR